MNIFKRAGRRIKKEIGLFALKFLLKQLSKKLDKVYEYTYDEVKYCPEKEAEGARLYKLKENINEAKNEIKKL